jgi:hypothetical protein
MVHALGDVLFNRIQQLRLPGLKTLDESSLALEIEQSALEPTLDSFKSRGRVLQFLLRAR